PVLALTPAQFAPAEVGELTLRSRQLPTGTDQQLLAKPEMQSQPQHQEGPYRLSRCARIEAFVRHQAKDLVGDLAVLADRTLRLQHRQDRLKRVPVHPRDTLHFLLSSGAITVEGIAEAVPVRAGGVDLRSAD